MLEDGLPIRSPEVGDRSNPQDGEYPDDVPPGVWRGWLGTGQPRSAPFMGRHRPYADGGGLCSPGRWPPDQRVLPEIGQEAFMDRMVDLLQEDFRQKTGYSDILRLVLGLAAGAFEKCPFNAKLLEKSREMVADEFDIPSGARGAEEGQTMYLGILGGMLSKFWDPDWQYVADWGLGSL